MFIYHGQDQSQYYAIAIISLRPSMLLPSVPVHFEIAHPKTHTTGLRCSEPYPPRGYHIQVSAASTMLTIHQPCITHALQTKYPIPDPTTSQTRIDLIHNLLTRERCPIPTSLGPSLGNIIILNIRRSFLSPCISPPVLPYHIPEREILTIMLT